MNQFAQHISSLKLMNNLCRRMTLESLFTRKVLSTIATWTITSYNNDDDPSIHPLYAWCKELNKNKAITFDQLSWHTMIVFDRWLPGDWVKRFYKKPQFPPVCHSILAFFYVKFIVLGNCHTPTWVRIENACLVSSATLALWCSCLQQFNHESEEMFDRCHVQYTSWFGCQWPTQNHINYSILLLCSF